MKSLHLAGACTIMFALGIGGCGPTDFTVSKKPSYADLVVTYNAEVQTLDNLEEKRNRLIAEHLSQVQSKAFKAAVDSLNSGVQSKNPNEALDQAVAAAEVQAKLQSGLLENLESSTPSGSAKSATNSEYPEELKRKLTELDAEIADQKTRVERARKARDEAQPK